MAPGKAGTALAFPLTILQNPLADGDHGEAEESELSDFLYGQHHSDTAQGVVVAE